ncbi:HAD-IA family hydrolase [Shimia sp. R10_1]|uniref:HAD-IA family hydrolase n=1 Tax=Shimia sp. R10_1 TaxID=2821095 RepID=UPI001AD96D50|nr:HAD-IA family hydrolase [Shimia sp. R10_1]MBO9472773.1 HAD-IA family hydrolase [Shimia sp. R10_1]
MRLKLVIFDVDGTLVDSQGLILAAMRAAFAEEGLQAPTRESILGIVGLSLDVAVFKLVPDLEQTQRARLVDGYKQSYMQLRAAQGAAQSSPFYPGAFDALTRLRAREDVLLGVATGKSRRGLDKLIAGHGLEGYFVTTQVADDHPSKPHPSMIETAMLETGATAAETVMIGDTSFDMEMAAAAGVTGIAVKWGYHPAKRLGAAQAMLDDFGALDGALEQIWGLQP